MSANVNKLEASAAIVLDRRFPGVSGNGKKQAVMSSSVSSKMAARIRYQDFLPENSSKRTSGQSPEAFHDLLEKANDWLRKNTSAQVKVSETVTWLSHDRRLLDDCCEQMTMSKKIEPHSSTHYCRGLRLWLVPRTLRRPETICCRDFVPEKSTDSIQTLIGRANKKFGHASWRGQVMTIESVSVPILSPGSLDSGVTQWTESGDLDAPSAFIIRVFFTKYHRTRPYSSGGALLGTKDIVPRPKDDGYEGFEELIERANTWLRDQSDVLVTNMQSLTVQKHSGPHSETGSSCYYTIPGLNNDRPTEFFRILRLAYLKPLGSLHVDLPVIHPFSCQTFAPDVLRVREQGGAAEQQGISAGLAGPAPAGQPEELCRMERMRETFAKAIAHLRTSGSELICAETVVNPMQFYAEDTGQDAQQQDEISLLLTIRLFLTKQLAVYDADAKRSSIVSSKGRGGSSPPPAGHPGPIFLRNVVTRRFKYRWLAVGIFAVTCMTIIVVLSVVYSNR